MMKRIKRFLNRKILSTELLAEVERSNLSRIQQLIEEGADVNYRNEQGKTALHLSEDPDITAFLIDYGLCVDALDKDRQTPLHLAVTHNRIKTQQLIKGGANVNYTNQQGKTALHLSKDPDITALLIENGACVDALDENRQTPLHRAAIDNRYDIASALLYYNADPSILDRTNRTPLIWASKLRFRPEIVELLLPYEDAFSFHDPLSLSLLKRAIEIDTLEFFVSLDEDDLLCYDRYLLRMCIKHFGLEEFKHFWSLYKYKHVPGRDSFLLSFVLEHKKYDIFDHVIESSQIVDVIESIYDKKVTPEHFCLHDVLAAGYDSAYSIERAEKAIYVLLSYGYEPYESEAMHTFQRLGNCELFKLFLHLDVLKPSKLYCPLIAKILLNPDKSIETLIYEFYLKSEPVHEACHTDCRESIDKRSTDKFIKLLSPCLRGKIDRLDSGPFSYEKRNVLLLCLDGLPVKEGSPDNPTFLKYGECMRRLRNVPSLVEISRNKARLGIWEGFKMKSRSQFYTTLEWMDIPRLIKNILSFDVPLYCSYPIIYGCSFYISPDAWIKIGEWKDRPDDNVESE